MGKRKAHFSSQIVSGQLTRNRAIALLNEDLYSETELRADIEFLCKKLEISLQEFEYFLTLPNKSYFDYPNWGWRYRFLKKLPKTGIKVL